jgi:sporulation protein YunB
LYRFFGRLPRRGPLPFRYVFLLSFVFFVFSTAIGLWIVNEGIEPTLMSVAETKTRQIATEAINDAISKKIAEDVNINELIIIHKDNAGEAIGYSFNPLIYNRITFEATERVQKYLDYVEAGDIEKLESFKNGIDIDFEKPNNRQGILYFIPLGVATKNALLSNLGPKVPVRFEIIGDVISKVETRMKETGINNTYLEVYLKIRVQMNVIIPSLKKDITISNSVKIGDLFLPGKVPQFYNGNQNGFQPAVIPPKKTN